MTLRAEIVTMMELVGAAAISAVLNFGYIVIAARTLGPRDFGDLMAALSLVFLVTVTLGPLASAVARVVAARAHDSLPIAAIRRPIVTAVRIRVLIALAPAAGIAFVATRFLGLADPLLLPVAVVVAGTYLLLSIERAVFQGAGDFRSYNVNAVAEAGIRLGFAIVAASVTRSTMAMLIAYGIGTVVSLLLMMRKWRGSHEPLADPSAVAAMISLAMPLIVLMAGTALFQNADLLAMKRWFPSETAGQYAAASNLVKSIGVVFVPLYVMAGPMLTTAYGRGRTMTPIVLRLSAYFLLFAIPPLVLFAYAGETLTTLIYGPAYRAAGALVAPIGGALIIGYLALMIAQAHVTARDPFLPRMYATGGVILLAALWLRHGSIAAVITNVYFVVAIILLISVATLPRRRRSGDPLEEAKAI